jgi:hypothetical protein
MRILALDIEMHVEDATSHHLNEKENYSHSTRSRAYDQRFRQAYEELNDNDKYRAAYIMAEQLVARDAANRVG